MAQTSEITPDIHTLAHLLLTSEKPFLMVGSSTRWGWNDTDMARQTLISRLEESLPGLHQTHVPDGTSLETLTFSPGLSILTGIPRPRMEALLDHLDKVLDSCGQIVVCDDFGLTPRKGHIHIDVRTTDSLHALLETIDYIYEKRTLVPWGSTPEGRAYAESLKKFPENRPDWKWDETRSINIPEEFRHDLAAGLDEHAE